MRVSAVAADFAARALHRRFASPASAGVAELASNASDTGTAFRTSLRSMRRPRASRVLSSRSSAPSRLTRDQAHRTGAAPSSHADHQPRRRSSCGLHLQEDSDAQCMPSNMSPVQAHAQTQHDVCAAGNAAASKDEVAAALASVPDRAVTANEAGLLAASFVPATVRRLVSAVSAGAGSLAAGTGCPHSRRCRYYGYWLRWRLGRLRPRPGSPSPRTSSAGSAAGGTPPWPSAALWKDLGEAPAVTDPPQALGRAAGWVRRGGGREQWGASAGGAGCDSAGV